MNLLKIITFLGIFIVVAFGAFIFFDIRKILKTQTNVEKDDMMFQKCPDFFESKGDKCINTYKLGTGEDLDISDETYKHIIKGNENKCLWARKNKVPWDGIERLC